jgi:anti-anti-sigma regulatory factor
MATLIVKTKEIKLSGKITPERQDKFIERIRKALNQKGKTHAVCVVLSSI